MKHQQALVAVKTFCEHIDHLRGLGDFLSERHAELEQPAQPADSASKDA
jgi:hypothetical protein